MTDKLPHQLASQKLPAGIVRRGNDLVVSRDIIEIAAALDIPVTEYVRAALDIARNPPEPDPTILQKIKQWFSK